MIASRNARTFLLSFVTAMAVSGSAWSAGSYPTKPGRLIVPFGTGASTDIIEASARAYINALNRLDVLKDRLEGTSL